MLDGVLKRPLLYLSLCLKRNREAYYHHLERVRTYGAWEDWLRFFSMASSRSRSRRPMPSGGS